MSRLGEAQSLHTSQNPLLGKQTLPPSRRGARQGGEEGAGLAGHEQLAYLEMQNGACCKDTRGREAERVGRLARGKTLDKADVEAVPARPRRRERSLAQASRRRRRAGRSRWSKVICTLPGMVAAFV